MYLEHIDIVGFRGINRLSLTLTQPVQRGASITGSASQGQAESFLTNTVLIGENAWGKSSLLDALTLLLSPEPKLYCFKEEDFYFPAGEQESKSQYLHVVFTFCENQAGHHTSPRFNPLSPLWVKCADKLNRIYYRLEGELDDDGSVMTLRSFLSSNGQPLNLTTIDPLAWRGDCWISCRCNGSRQPIRAICFPWCRLSRFAGWCVNPGASRLTVSGRKG
jgi:putative ATP-dependent endonuclease of OLD family